MFSKPKKPSKPESTCYMLLVDRSPINIKHYLQGFYDSYLIEKAKLMPENIYQSLDEAAKALYGTPDARYLLTIDCSKEEVLNGDPRTGLISKTPLHKLIKTVTNAEFKSEKHVPSK